MDEQKIDLRQRTYYYVQPADNKTNNFLRTALPENPVSRSPGDAVGAPIPSSHHLYLVPWKDVECFMQITYVSFNVFARKERESLPHFAMRKSPEMEKRNEAKTKPNGEKFSLIKKIRMPTEYHIRQKVLNVVRPTVRRGIPENLNLANKNSKRLEKVLRPQKRTLILLTLPKKKKSHKLVLVQKTVPKIKWATYVIIPQKDTSNGITMAYIRKSLLDCGLNTQSVYESGKLEEKNLEQVWEASGDVLFRLWRYARKNPLIHFSVFRTSKDGRFQNFKQVFYYPKSESVQTENKVLKFQQK